MGGTRTERGGCPPLHIGPDVISSANTPSVNTQNITELFTMTLHLVKIELQTRVIKLGWVVLNVFRHDNNLWSFGRFKQQGKGVKEWCIFSNFMVFK